MNSPDTTAEAGLRCPCCGQRFPAQQTGWNGRCWACLGFTSPESFAAHRAGQTVARTMPPTKPPADPLEAEIAAGLVGIENNYLRETSGYGSRFEGERLEVVQARWAIRRVREELTKGE